MKVLVAYKIKHDTDTIIDSCIINNYKIVREKTLHELEQNIINSFHDSEYNISEIKILSLTPLAE